MKKSNDFYKLNKEDKDKIMFFYLAPNGTWKKYWEKLIDERKKGDKKMLSTLWVQKNLNYLGYNARCRRWYKWQ